MRPIIRLYTEKQSYIAGKSYDIDLEIDIYCGGYPPPPHGGYPPYPPFGKHLCNKVECPGKHPPYNPSIGLKGIEIYLNNTLYQKIDTTEENVYYTTLAGITEDTVVRVMVFDNIGYNEASMNIEFKSPMWYGINDNLSIFDKDFPLSLTFTGSGYLVIKYPEKSGYLTRATNDGDDYLPTLNCTTEKIGGIDYLIYKSKEKAIYNNTTIIFDNNTVLPSANIYYGVGKDLTMTNAVDMPTTLTFNGKGLAILKYKAEYGLLSSAMNGGDNYLPTFKQGVEIINGIKYYTYTSKKIAEFVNTEIEFFVKGGNK